MELKIDYQTTKAEKRTIQHKEKIRGENQIKIDYQISPYPQIIFGW